MRKRRAHFVTYLGVAAVLVSALLLPRSVLLASSRPDVVRRDTTAPMMPALVSRAGSSDVFYVVASTGCGEVKCVRLYRTTINVSTFTRVTLPPLSRQRGGVASTTLDRLVFANAEDGYATVGGYSPSALYVTTNGARTWRKVMGGKDLTIDVNVSVNEVIVTVRSCVPRTEECGQYTTERSSLDARHWVTVPRLWKTGTGNNDVYYGPSIATIGHEVLEVESANSGVYVWRSDNDGRTFSRVSEPFPALVSVAGCSITPMSLESFWAECPTGLQVSFWHSSDGGLKWTRVPTTQFMGTGGGAFDPLSANVAYLDYGTDLKGSDLFRVTDAGLHETAVGREGCPDVLSLDFVSISRGLKLCSDYPGMSLTQTDNGGATWKKVVLPRGSV